MGRDATMVRLRALSALEPERLILIPLKNQLIHEYEYTEADNENE